MYAIELVRAMADHDRRDGYAVYTRADWFDSLKEGRPNWRVERVPATSRGRRLLWEQASLPASLRRLGIDVLHSTHHTLPIVGVRCRRVVTIHDLTFLRWPQRYPAARRLYMQLMTRLSSRVADAIIVPSRVVRDDVKHLLHVPEQRIEVVYEAAAESFAPVESEAAAAVARRYGLDGPYVLSVGSLEPGKNRARLIRAMRVLRDEGIDFALAVVGQPGWRYQADAVVIEEHGMDDRVVTLGYVPDEDLPALYSGAAVFAYPSLHEGFGLCLLEAMACGAPVLTSNVSATAEIAGDAALLVDPRSVEAIAGGLRTMLCASGVRDDLRGRGFRRATEFSWRRAAAETYAIYERVAQSTRPGA